MAPNEVKCTRISQSHKLLTNHHSSNEGSVQVLLGDIA